jgi:hypothetical protein
VATVSVDGSGSDDETFRAWRPAYDSSTANAAATTSPSHVEAEIILQRPNLQAVHRTDTGISNGNGAHHEPPKAPVTSPLLQFVVAEPTPVSFTEVSGWSPRPPEKTLEAPAAAAATASPAALGAVPEEFACLLHGHGGSVQNNGCTPGGHDERAAEPDAARVPQLVANPHLLADGEATPARLLVVVEEARGLPKMELTGADPYCVVWHQMTPPRRQPPAGTTAPRARCCRAPTPPLAVS